MLIRVEAGRSGKGKREVELHDAFFVIRRRTIGYLSFDGRPFCRPSSRVPFLDYPPIYGAIMLHKSSVVKLNFILKLYNLIIFTFSALII